MKNYEKMFRDLGYVRKETYMNGNTETAFVKKLTSFPIDCGTERVIWVSVENGIVAAYNCNDRDEMSVATPLTVDETFACAKWAEDLKRKSGFPRIFQKEGHHGKCR